MAKAEQIRASIANMDSEIIKDALSILLAKEPGQSSSNTQRNEISSNYKNFAQAILALKRQYKFPELDFFSVEADLVYVSAGDRRVLLTDREAALKAPPPQRTLDSDLPADEVETPNQDEDKNEDSIENAFEPIKNNESRFSHLEL